MRPFSESLPMALLRAREAVMRLFRPGLRKRGVTEQQWRILRALAHAGPMEITELAEATFLLAPSLSRILPQLEQRSLVSRKQVDSDLRRSVIRLEPQGLRVIASHAPYSEEVYAQILKRFGERKMLQLSELLLELEGALQALDFEQTSTARRSDRKALER